MNTMEEITKNIKNDLLDTLFNSVAFELSYNRSGFLENHEIDCLDMARKIVQEWCDFETGSTVMGRLADMVMHSDESII